LSEQYFSLIINQSTVFVSRLISTVERSQLNCTQYNDRTATYGAPALALRPCSVANFFAKWPCSTFRCYLIISV
jgi:hypothetical protein